jgi:hypothetical protein
VDYFDDVVIGSGLAALGTVMGLASRRRILVLSGEVVGAFSHYDAKKAVPCAFSGAGGLGGYWHGVIPVSGHQVGDTASTQIFAELFKRFYPRADIDQWLGKPALFVPWKPIRPAAALAQLATQREGRLSIVAAMAERIDADGPKLRITSSAGEHHATRVWVAAGAVHTPDLLARSFGEQMRRGHIADHVLCYVGQIDHAKAPHTHRTSDGVYFPALQDEAQTALYTLRPARFSFRTLDHGIEQRAAFGLPTGNAISKIMRSMSPGLLAEAFYNRFGLFASAQRYSIYAQTPVECAYALGTGPTPLTADLDKIQAAASLARQRQPFGGAALSQRPDLFIPGIHLHHSVDKAALMQAGINQAGSRIWVVDASQLDGIGPEHHSFKMLSAACRLAQSSN